MYRREQLGAVAAIQGRQLGLVSLAQSRGLGVSDDLLYQEVRAGRMRRVRTGVFAVVGAPNTYEQELLAVVLAAGGASSLSAASHEPGAYLLGLPRPSRERPCFEVTTDADRKPKLPGVRVHRSLHLGNEDITYVAAVPVTTATRTIVDLSMRFDRTQLGRLADDALRRRMTSLGALQRTALRLRSAPGRSQLRVLALVMARTGEDASESVLEEFAIAALKRFRVRRPTAQYPVRVQGGRRRRIDLAYEVEKAAIEALGFEFHGLRSRFDEDAVRNNELVRAGYTPLFVTSAMTDWEVASLVAEAIGDPLPARPPHELTFQEWRRRRGL